MGLSNYLSGGAALKAIPNTVNISVRQMVRGIVAWRGLPAAPLFHARCAARGKEAPLSPAELAHWRTEILTTQMDSFSPVSQCHPVIPAKAGMTYSSLNGCLLTKGGDGSYARGMGVDISHKLIVAISSRALFDLDESNQVFEAGGVEEYARYQMAHENEILTPGVAFPLVKKFLNLNQYGDLVEVILLSRNSADTGLRIFNSIEHYGLAITRAAFTGGQSPYQYVNAFGSHLFLSVNGQDVAAALRAGCAAATILPSNNTERHAHELRFAFDGDAVLFSDEAERVFQEQGLNAFTVSEKLAAQQPLSGGPFQGFLFALQKLQQHLPPDNCPIRTALVTARQAPAHERPIRTLRSWQIRIDEALFLGGLEKSEFLHAFGADIFFDDQPHHCQKACPRVATAHVPHGVLNVIED